MRVPIEANSNWDGRFATVSHHPLKMRVPIEAQALAQRATTARRRHHPLKMRVPIEASTIAAVRLQSPVHHPLKMRVPIEATSGRGDNGTETLPHHPLKMRVPIEAPMPCSAGAMFCASPPSPSENEGPY